MKRICVVGSGRWGQNHLRTLSGIGALAGIVETSAARLAQMTALYPGVNGHAGLEDALRAGYDGYVVATPAETHFAIASRLLDAGFPVLVEKPMTLLPEESALLVEKAAAHHVTLMVGHLLLFHPAVRKIKSLIDEGAVGDLMYISSSRLNLGTVRTTENVFFSFAPHDISVLDYLIGQPAVRMEAQGARLLQPGICDTTLAELTYPGNIHAHIHVSWLHPFKEQRLVVVGSRGMLTFDDASDKKIYLYHKYITFNDGVPVKMEEAPEVVPYEQGVMPLEEELRYFIAHPDGTATVADGRCGLETVKVLYRVQQLLDQDVQA